jgi:putative FmdB family regulatory protein
LTPVRRPVNLKPMPIYEYRCDRCGTGFEELVFSDTRVVCPSCRAESVTRRPSVPAPARAAQPAAAPACDMGRPAPGCCGGGACLPH